MALTIGDHEYLDWRVWTPPRLTWVWALYREADKPQLVKTCRHGCCVHSFFGCMVLPRYWRLASEEEGATEQAEWDKLRKPIDMMAFYDVVKQPPR